MVQEQRTYAFVSRSQVDVLEQDTLAVLCLVRSFKNSFAPINKIPRAILSLIPNYLGCHETENDDDLITLTHVCCGWRELFVSKSSLWTRLDLTNVDKTLAYIKRSRSSPLDVVLHGFKREPRLEDTFPPAVPHIKRFKSLTLVFVGASDLQNLTKQFTLPAPLLKSLIITLACDSAPTLDTMLFNGDFPSLCTLSLEGVITRLPWKNLWNLTTFRFHRVPGSGITVTQLLNFLEGAPRLRDVILHHSIPTSSNASSERVVPLPHLKNLSLVGTTHSVLLNHLSIPEGALLVLEFNFSGDKSPFPDNLPKAAKNLRNLFRITTVNLCFNGAGKLVQLDGPSGRLRIFGNGILSLDLDRRIFHSLNYFSLHITRRLAITEYKPPTLTEIEKSPPYRVLLRMKDLRTLTLIQCNNIPFILALNPDHNPSKLVPCPDLEELVLYIETQNAFNIPELVNMAKERASKGARLRLITVVGLGELVPGKEVFKLREHVAHVEYRFEEKPPNWDNIPEGESG